MKHAVPSRRGSGGTATLDEMENAFYEVTEEVAEAQQPMIDMLVIHGRGGHPGG